MSSGRLSYIPQFQVECGYKHGSRQILSEHLQVPRTACYYCVETRL